jgi:hypothetical protein
MQDREPTKTAFWCDMTGNSLPVKWNWTWSILQELQISSLCTFRTKFLAVQHPLLVEIERRGITMVPRTHINRGNAHWHSENNERWTASKQNAVVQGNDLWLYKS